MGRPRKYESDEERREADRLRKAGQRAEAKKRLKRRKSASAKASGVPPQQRASRRPRGSLYIGDPLAVEMSSLSALAPDLIPEIAQVALPAHLEIGVKIAASHEEGRSVVSEMSQAGKNGLAPKGESVSPDRSVSGLFDEAVKKARLMALEPSRQGPDGKGGFRTLTPREREEQAEEIKQRAEAHARWHVQAYLDGEVGGLY